MKSKRTKALDISQATREKVYQRDNGRCIFCHSHGIPNAHFIPRSDSGLGISQNIITACKGCHYDLDMTIKRKEMLQIARKHLDRFYPDFTDEMRRYKK